MVFIYTFVFITSPVSPPPQISLTPVWLAAFPNISPLPHYVAVLVVCGKMTRFRKKIREKNINWL